MLGLLGLFGALCAGVLVDSLAQSGPDDETDTDAENNSTADDLELSNIFHMLSSREASAVGDAGSLESRDTSQDGVNASDDLPAPAAEDLWLSGDDLDNFLSGDAGNDMLFGNAGKDAIAGGAGDDQLDGGADDDALNGGAGDDSLNAGMGADLLHGGAGDDGLAGGGNEDSLFGCDGNDNLAGGDAADALAGGSGNDTLAGDAGDDALDGGDGCDLQTGGAGSDTLDGGAGNDTIWGQRDGEDDNAPDFLNGGADDDTLLLGAGDYGNGGAGTDSFQLLDIGADDPPMQITDFNPQEDALVVMYDANTHPDPRLTMQTSASGTTLLLDGVPLANLQSVLGLNLDSIVLKAA